MTSRELLRQTILDESHGNMEVAFESTIDRLLIEYVHAEKQGAEVAAWRAGATLGYMRLKAGTVGTVDDVPDDTLHDHWLKTATA